MSFFGFDSTLPRDRQGQGATKGIFEQDNPFAGIAQARKLQAFQENEDEVLDFDATYDGLGDRLEETGDDLNDDTFGGGAEGGAQSNEFDFFGNTARYSNAINEESMRYGLQHQSQRASEPDPVDRPKRTGYERYQDPGFIGEIQSKSSAWKNRSQPQPQVQAQAQDVAPERISTARATAPQRKMMSLEEVEASLRAQGAAMPPHQPPMFAFPQQQQPPFPMQQQPLPQTMYQSQPIPTNMSNQRPQDRIPPQPIQDQGQAPLQILQNPNRTRHSPHPSQDKAQFQQQPMLAQQMPTIPVITNPQQLMELSEEQRRAYLEEDAKRAKRNHKIFMLSKGNGLMTPQDKNFITRIQLQQLVAATGNSADPTPEAALVEDFYYQVYSQIRGAPRQHPTQPLGHFAQTYLFQTGGRYNNHRRQAANGDNHMQRMQQQVQRAVEAAKLKPKNKQLIIEGSLGKISFSNAKTPKPLLNIKRQDSGDPRPASARKDMSKVSPSDRKSILRNIEAAYATLMKMEDHERKIPPPPPTEGDADAIQAHAHWRAEMQTLNAELWQDLKVLDPIVPGSTVTHPFIAFLAFSKGKKAIPRIFRHIDQEQRVTILTMIVVHLDQLDVIRGARIAPGESQPSPAIREEIELFSHMVMPSLLGYVSEAPINIMIGLLGLLMDHTNVVSVARTKIGLNFMTMLLSRAELVKEAGAASDQEWEQWVSLYTHLFDVLEPVLASTFPGPVNSGDDMYVWQFLAAVGIGASLEQQQRLVLAVKDRVMDTVSQSRALPAEMSSQRLGNVNLFMRAIGLDVEMLG